MFEGCLRTFTSAHYMKGHYSLMHVEPLQCENILLGCNFHTCSWSTLVKHKRYFCELREIMQVEEDKYFEEPKEHKLIYTFNVSFLTKKFVHASQSCLQLTMLLERVLTIYICKVWKLLLMSFKKIHETDMNKVFYFYYYMKRH